MLGNYFLLTLKTRESAFPVVVKGYLFILEKVIDICGRRGLQDSNFLSLFFYNISGNRVRNIKLQ